MGTILRINSELARKNPEQVYTRPADIIGEIGLTRGQKIAALKRWEGRVQARLGHAPENAHAFGDVCLLSAIKDARASLEANRQVH
jgi:hypothetical protein